MALRVYNTLTRSKEVFEPVHPGKVGIYLCGPTVYDRAHIGHMVGPVVFDTIKRYLVHSGYQVTWVVNITDVDDKLIKKSQQRGIPMAEVARENTADYLQNLAGLGVDQIDQMPKATESMDEIIAFVRALIDRGYAYEEGGDVFFDVGRDPEYGKLTNRTVEALQGEGGEAAAKKHSAADFALWKAAKPGEPSWDSPWGQGRPGWHIECSAMSRGLLGETFDIHGGGLDLIFPHHENEIAQSECCHDAPMAKYWLHNGLLKRAAAGKIGGRAERQSAAPGQLSLEDIQQATAEKESRSAGAGGLADMIRTLGGEQIRFFLLRTHYRSTVVYSDEALQESTAALETYYRFFERLERVSGERFHDLPLPTTRAAGVLDPAGSDLLREVARCRQAFLDKMDDDFNTGGAISELFELVRLLNKFVDQHAMEETKPVDATQLQQLRRGATVLRELAGILGLFVKPPTTESADADHGLVSSLMDLILELRANARQKKDFATADRIRDVLKEIGITVEDRKGGSNWRRE